MVMYTFNPSIWEAQVGGLWGLGQPELYSEWDPVSEKKREEKNLYLNKIKVNVQKCY
jgi:hypothetical protein